MQKLIEKRLRTKQQNCNHENSCRDWDCWFGSEGCKICLIVDVFDEITDSIQIA